MNKQYISNDLADKTLHLKLMNMRKSIILLAFILGGFTVGNAQSVVEGTKFMAGELLPLLTVLSLKVCVPLLEWESQSN